MLLAAAAFGTTACATIAIVTAAGAAVAVVEAADVSKWAVVKHHTVPYSMCDIVHQADASL